MPILETAADKVSNAEHVALDLFNQAPDDVLDAEQLVTRVNTMVNDLSIASLAVWRLIDSGHLAFVPGSRRQLRKVT